MLVMSMLLLAGELVFILDPKPARVYGDIVMLVTSSGIPLMLP